MSAELILALFALAVALGTPLLVIMRELFNLGGVLRHLDDRIVIVEAQVRKLLDEDWP